MARRLALTGDKTTKGHIVCGSSNMIDHGKRLVRSGDMAWCDKCNGAFQINGTATGWLDTHFHVGDGDSVHCGCNDNYVIATSDFLCDSCYPGRQTAIRHVPLLATSFQQDPVQHAQTAKIAKTQISAKERPEALPLPYVIFTTQRKMDDYEAPDMKHGDLTEAQLKDQYGLKDVSVRVNPYLIPDRKATAAVLFNEFRDLSDLYSWHGEYSGLMRKMIQHMQENTGHPFNDPMLDKAMKERILGDKSANSTLLALKNALSSRIDGANKIYPLSYKKILSESVEGKILPKFTHNEDSIDGLGIAVHDTWSTQITLESLEVNDADYSAVIKYHIQDHFGLDNTDVNNLFFKQFRIFRIWFVLQHWNEYNYKPFITDINAIIEVRGSL